jgi:DedD protein
MDKALKQRLVGASVLIILAVIVLPMLLSGRSDTLKQESREIELPPKPEELSIETRRFPVGVPNKPAPANDRKTGGQEEVQNVENDAVSKIAEQQASSAKQATNELSSAGTPDTELDPPISTKEKPPAVTSITLTSQRDKDVNATQASDISPDTPRYLVQVASFSSEKNANALAGQLRAENLNVLMDVVDRTAGRLHRVRVGPYMERAEADAVVASVRSKIKDVIPRVLDLRPAESAPVSTPSDPLVRWVVQVGNFGESQRAESLVAELRLEGMTAFSEKVTSTGGTSYKVQIGPELDRDKAAVLARNLKSRYPDAFVTTRD